MSKKAIVIGSGVGGLAIAIRLAARGFRVQIFESSDYPGGKLSEIRNAGYRFDAGPSLFTLPELVDDLFGLCGKTPRDYFSYQKLDSICRYHYEDGTIINAWQDPSDFARELEEKTADKAADLTRFLAHSRELYELTSPVFIFRSFHRLSTFFSRDFIRALLRINRLKAFSSMHQVISRSFSDSRTIRLFDRYATYNGSNPFRAPGTLNVIPYLEHELGAFFPSGGMHRITESLVDLAVDQGVELKLGQAVDEIIIKAGRAVGVRSGGTDFVSDIVVSDVDIVKAYELLPGIKLPKRFLEQERSTSAMIFYWGMKGELPSLDLHNIFFSDNYPEEFNWLFEKKSLYSDPTVYVYVSAVADKSDAPEGCRNWFVMINTPENVGQDWTALRSFARSRILEKLERMLGMTLEDKIEVEEVLDPVLIESRTSSWHGSLYGISSNNRMAAFSRHPNFSRRISGLYFVGGSVHPGGGIPLCLASAKIVDGMIK